MHSAADAAGRHGADRRGRDAAGAYGEKGRQGQIDAQICVSLASSRNAHVKLHPSNASHAGVRRNTCRPFASLFSSLYSEKKEKFLELDAHLALDELERITTVQATDPRVQLFASSDDPPAFTLEFACDEGTALFRNALRQAIWGLGSFRSILSKWAKA